MRLSPKTLLSVVVLTGIIGAGVLWTYSTRGRSTLPIVASVAAPRPDVTKRVQLLQEQLAFATAEAEQRPEEQGAASQELLRDLAERLADARVDAARLVRLLEEQLVLATAQVERLPVGQRVASEELVRDLTERLRIARIRTGL